MLFCFGLGVIVFSGDRLDLYEGTQFILGDVRAGSPRGTQAVGVYKGTQFVFVHTVYLDCPPQGYTGYVFRRGYAVSVGSCVLSPYWPIIWSVQLYPADCPG